jgi:hypothetical protein
MSLWDYIHKYAPAADKNNPVKYTQDMVDRFNRVIGENVITKDTSLGELKESLSQAGLDPEHTITRAHLQTEDPSVLKALDSQSTNQPTTVETKSKAATKQEPAFDFQNLFPIPNSGPPTPLIQKPKTQPKVTTTPTKKESKKQTTVTPVQKPSTVDNASFGEDVINTYNDFENAVKKGVSSGVNAVTSSAATVGRNIAELFEADEDQINVLKYLENGGTVFDAYDMYKNQQAKKLGSEGSDLIGESKSITPSVDVETTMTNWGTKFVKPKENLVSKKYVVDTKEIASSPSVDQDEYTSNSFAINLKANSINKFTVLPNIHANSNVGNINDYYNNFTPVNGSLVFTIQNDVAGGKEKPLTTISKEDTWYKNAENIIKMNGNKLEVVKSKDVKEGDKVFKLTNKIFSFDDLDIKDGKINTVYDSNINALIPKVKSDAKTYKSGSSFIIGLTDKKKSPGYIPLDEATQYGKSRGGSFILFSEDLDQQYMVGGSFKNLYDFYQNVKKIHPDKTFKVFASDTGSYSNSFFPKDGKIDGDVYRKSNNRNVWGEVQHLILMN